MATNTSRVAVIAGDGIGPEVIAAGMRVLGAAAALDGGFTRSNSPSFPGAPTTTSSTA